VGVTTFAITRDLPVAIDHETTDLVASVAVRWLSKRFPSPLLTFRASR
jgi:hypothetical protein